MTLPPHINGLIFDCDGTIADTMPLHYKAWVTALGRHSVEFPEALFYEFAGVPTTKIIATLNERHGHHMPIEETAEHKEKLFVDLYLDQVQPIEPIVKYVHQYAGKLPMAVASGGYRSIVHKTLELIHLSQYFQAVVTTEDVVHGKPAPDIFLKAAELIGVPPEHCAVFEDGDPGLVAAKAAGMLAIDIRPLR